MSTNHIRTLIRTVNAMNRVLHPRPKLMRLLPHIVVDEYDHDWPGYAEENERMRRYASANGVGLKVYAGFDPNMDGTER